MIAKLETQKTPKKHYPQNEQQSWNLWSQPWNRIYKDTVKFLNLFLISKKITQWYHTKSNNFCT